MHEECLAGFTTWGATAYPVPLSWGATFDPELVERDGRRGSAATMRAVGVHQGLAPVLDVVRDYRWGRVEETIGEDPYLVGTIGDGVRAGAGVAPASSPRSSTSRATRRPAAGRNLAPVRWGRASWPTSSCRRSRWRVREGGVRSVMHSYAEIDGVPAAANEELLTGLLRDTWGFTGTVVADYFGIGFLQPLHGVAADLRPTRPASPSTAGVDVELPDRRRSVAPLIEAVEPAASTRR